MVGRFLFYLVVMKYVIGEVVYCGDIFRYVGGDYLQCVYQYDKLSDWLQNRECD